MSFIAIYITHSNEATAKQLSDVLIEKKLVACANLFPIQSAYRWKGKVVVEGEWVSLVKTIPERWEAVCRLVEELHPYEVPCIMKYEVAANAAYENWIRECVLPDPESLKT